MGIGIEARLLLISLDLSEYFFQIIFYKMGYNILLVASISAAYYGAWFTVDLVNVTKTQKFATPNNYAHSQGVANEIKGGHGMGLSITQPIISGIAAMHCLNRIG